MYININSNYLNLIIHAHALTEKVEKDEKFLASFNYLSIGYYIKFFI